MQYPPKGIFLFSGYLRPFPKHSRNVNRLSELNTFIQSTRMSNFILYIRRDLLQNFLLSTDKKTHSEIFLKIYLKLRQLFSNVYPTVEKFLLSGCDSYFFSWNSNSLSQLLSLKQSISYESCSVAGSTCSALSALFICIS